MNFKMLKKGTALLLSLLLMFSLTACGSDANGAANNDQSAGGTSQSTEGTASSGADTSNNAEDFSIVLDWYPNAVHAFIYVAIEKGYYAEEGLNVKVEFPANTNDAITMTAAGQADAGLYYQPNTISTATNQDIPGRWQPLCQRRRHCRCLLIFFMRMKKNSFPVPQI